MLLLPIIIGHIIQIFHKCIVIILYMVLYMHNMYWACKKCINGINYGSLNVWWNKLLLLLIQYYKKISKPKPKARKSNS